MQKIIAIILALTCLCGMIGCTISGSETDYPAAIMVDGDVYYLVSESMAGEVLSFMKMSGTCVHQKTNAISLLGMVIGAGMV